MHDTLAILAGGEGSRMGFPKADLTIDSRPILQYLLEEIAWPGTTILVTAPGREHPPGWERFTLDATDPQAGVGPLRGVLTALEQLTTPLLILLTVDMPAIRRPQCDILLDHLRKNPTTLGVMMRRTIRSADSTELQLEPFPLAIRSEARPIIERRLIQNRRSIHGLLDEPGFIAIDAPKEWEEGVWTNLNTPANLESFKRRK